MMVGLDERFALRCLVDEMVDSTSFEDADQQVTRIRSSIGFSHTGWVPDISRPGFSPEADAFFRRHNWPGEILDLWWSRGAAIKTALYIRCRFTQLPFLTDLTDERPHAKNSVSSEERELTRIFLSHGLSTLLTIPVHLPRSQIELLVFAGNLQASAVRSVLKKAAPDLLAAGHYMMQAFRTSHPEPHALAEELSHLTRREWDCLRLLAQGCRDSEIARLNDISITTVRFHVENIVRKLGASNRIHAVALACQLGMVGPLGI